MYSLGNMYTVYSIALFFALLFYIPLYFFRLKVLKGDRLFLRERLGIDLLAEKTHFPSIWIHAVSVGEVLSLQNLVLELKKKHPDLRIYFSSLTNTGLRVAQEKLTGVDNIFFIPVDLPFIVRKFFRKIQPTLFVLAESEFWPNLLREAKRQTKGVLLINGRISPPSFKRYHRFRIFFRKIMNNIDFFLVQTNREKVCLEKIGMPPRLIEISGNLKTEVRLPALAENEIKELKASLFIPEGRRVILAGSTHKGEEEKLIDAFDRARKRNREVLLILAPRHPERADEIAQLFMDFPFQVVRRSELKNRREWDALILDSLGELSLLYSICDAAFVGGSLIPWGGQNFLEPAFYGKPIFFGPHMDNFQELADRFIEGHAARYVHSHDDLYRMFLLSDGHELTQMGNMARRLLESFQGATDRTVKRIEAFLEQH